MPLANEGRVILLLAIYPSSALHSRPRRHLVEIRQGDLFDADLREATVVTLYLSTKYNTRLIAQLNRMKPGSRVVSHLFSMDGIEPDTVVHATSKKDRWQHMLLLWKTPL